MVIEQLQREYFRFLKWGKFNVSEGGLYENDKNN
jgi:hypothetical protein